VKPAFVKFDENVATVPFNVPFKVPPLKGRFSEDSPSNEPKKVGEVITPYYLSLSSLLISLSYYLFLV
jgi:hypothetical protein